MGTKSILTDTDNFIQPNGLLKISYTAPSVSNGEIGEKEIQAPFFHTSKKLPSVLFISSYPPRECGIATYSHDLIRALNNKFENSFTIKLCALESANEKHKYTDEVKYVMNTSDPDSYASLAEAINENSEISIVLMQHEFGFFHEHSEELITFLNALVKPVILVFHTVLPHPDEKLKVKVQRMSLIAESLVVMTHTSEKILMADYGIAGNKISVIQHGTHLVPHLDKNSLKEKYGLSGKKVLSTFGLLSSGKNIETSLDALSTLVKQHPELVFLVIGKTHPTVVKEQGEKYREMLLEKVQESDLENHVIFINKYLSLDELLEYLQLTDIYLFTSKDPNQAVSGTFSYALSCGCPIISTPIPHAREVLGNDLGIIVDFENSLQMSLAIERLLNDEQLRNKISLNGLHRIAPTSWENSAIAHAKLFEEISGEKIKLHYKMPAIKLDHLKKLSTDFGMIQFSVINQPNIESGYTLDDNARALIAMCKHYKLTSDPADLDYIYKYFDFVKHCLRDEGYFSNYVNKKHRFTEQNNSSNLADANGRAIWAIGYVVSKNKLLPAKLISAAEEIMEQVCMRVNMMHSTRAMAFAIKGLYYYNRKKKSEKISSLIKTLANRMVQMYRHESDTEWEWFESYLTYANSILPEALLCAYEDSGEILYKEIACTSFNFLLSHIFYEDQIKVISNKGWMHKGKERARYGEQPIDVAYTILALDRFYNVFGEKEYKDKMEIAFNWFLGNNHLNRIIYNPCTGGCYDGLEEDHVNLNQGAESTISYLLARLTMEKYSNPEPKTFRLKKEGIIRQHRIN